MRLKDKAIMFESKKDATRAFSDLQTVGRLRLFPKTREDMLKMDDKALAAMIREAVEQLETPSVSSK